MSESKPNLDEVIDSSEVVIIGKHQDEFRVLSNKLSNGRVIIDLVRLLDISNSPRNYQGVCW